MMFRRAVTVTLAAVLAEQAAADWDWEGRTLDSRQVAGECSTSADSFSFVSKSQIPSAKVKTVESTVTSANKYTIDYFANFKVLTHSGDKQQYVLTQCGTTVPTATEVDAVKAVGADYTRKFFTVPLQKAIATETVGLGFIDALGLQDRVVSVSAYSVAPCWQKARMNCSAQEESSLGNATLAAAQQSSAEGVFMNCDDSGCSSANSISFKTTDEVGNLHQAEYIKVMAAFFNKEEEANRIFEAKVTAYQALKVSAPSTTVAWISYEPTETWNLGESFVISQSKYKLQMVTDAGYANVDLAALKTALPKLTIDTTVPAGDKWILKVADYADKAAAAAAFAEALKSVSVVIDEFYAPDPTAYNIDTFYTNYGLSSASEQSFITKVLRIDGTMSSDNQLDWYESRVANPEWALEGLRHSVTGDASLRSKYFRNIAAGVAPVVLDHTMCSVDMPTCGAFLPAIILRDGVTETSSARAPATFAVVALSLLALLVRA